MGLTNSIHPVSEGDDRGPAPALLEALAGHLGVHDKRSFF